MTYYIIDSPTKFPHTECTTSFPIKRPVQSKRPV